MYTHDIMIKILELKELESELKYPCKANDSHCKEVIRKRINALISIIGKEFAENPQLLKNHDLLIRVQELQALEEQICNLCQGICGECKNEIKGRLKSLCILLERNCENCDCDK